MLPGSRLRGSQNPGLQLYRIKEARRKLFGRISSSLHLPQYISFLLTGEKYSDITSIGCHTNLWNFSQDHYHEWVYREGIMDKLAPVMPSSSVIPVPRSSFANPGLASASGQPGHLPAGIGLHDSSAAMIPYLDSFQERFVLISTR